MLKKMRFVMYISEKMILDIFEKKKCEGVKKEVIMKRITELLNYY